MVIFFATTQFIANKDASLFVVNLWLRACSLDRMI